MVGACALRHRSALWLAVVSATLAGCDAAAPTPAGGVSEGEAQALSEAAEMLDKERRLPSEALPEISPTPTPQPEPSAEMTGDNVR
jgi:hypothetical protein